MQNLRFVKLWIRSSVLSWKDISHRECIDWGLKAVKGFLGGLLDAALFCSRSYPSWCRFHSLHFQPVVLHGRIGGIFWWVGLLVTKSELARCQGKRQGWTKTQQFLSLFCPPLSLNINDYGAVVRSMGKISACLTRILLRPGWLALSRIGALCSFVVTVIAEEERRKGSKAGGEIYQNGKPQKRAKKK